MPDTDSPPSLGWPAPPPPPSPARAERGDGSAVDPTRLSISPKALLPIDTGGWGRPPRPTPARLGRTDWPQRTADGGRPSTNGIDRRDTATRSPSSPTTSRYSPASPILTPDRDAPIVEPDTEADPESAANQLGELGPSPSLPGPAPTRPGRARPGHARRPRSRHRRRVTMVAELAVACLIVAIVGATTSGRHRNAPAPSAPPAFGSLPPSTQRALVDWGIAALPVIGRLVEDLVAAQRDVSSGAGIPDPTVTDDVAALRRDVAAARRLARPPQAAVARSWTTILGQLGQGGSDLAQGARDGATSGRSALAAARSELVAAGNELVQLTQLVGPPG